MVVLFIAYAACIGVSFSILGLIYTGASIFSMFLTSAVLFGVMSLAGYTTNTDLTKMGSILYMIFIGAFVASLINFFIGSSELDYILSFVFVAVLIGLTAYYIQMLKRIGAGIEFGTDSANKLVIIGAYVLIYNLHQLIYVDASFIRQKKIIKTKNYTESCLQKGGFFLCVVSSILLQRGEILKNSNGGFAGACYAFARRNVVEDCLLSRGELKGNDNKVRYAYQPLLHIYNIISHICIAYRERRRD